MGYEELNAIVETGTVGLDLKSEDALLKAFARDQKTWEEAGFDPDGVMKVLWELAQPPVRDYVRSLMVGDLDGLTPANIVTDHVTTAVCAFNLAVAAIQRMQMEEHFNIFVMPHDDLPDGTAKEV